MPWKTMDVREQRVNFVVTASRGEKPFGSPVPGVWDIPPDRVFVAGAVSARRAGGHRRAQPAAALSPDRTAPELEAQVVALRRRYPDWGARKLQVLLRRRGVELARSTIHRILLRHGLVRTGSPAPAPQRFERSAPNELWQMDFKGPLQRGDNVGPLSVIDDHSRYLVALKKVGSTSGELVREHLEGAFRECGVPDAMLMDHGIPWWSGNSPHGFTKLSLWLMKQGIGLHWGRIRHPQTQGKVERFHGELQRAVDARRPAAPELQTWLDEFRWEHNHLRPHEALGMETPASHWRPSERRYDPNPPAWEYPAGLVGAQGRQRWKDQAARTALGCQPRPQGRTGAASND